MKKSTRKLSPEQTKLKEFIEDNFDFDGLKSMGFFEKGMRKTDYEKIAERVCLFFGYKSIYEYGTPYLTQIGDAVIVGKAQDKVNAGGVLEIGQGFLLGIVQTEFTCPICECYQDACDSAAYINSKYPEGNIKCKGCKRKLHWREDMRGNITVYESTDKKNNL